MSPLSTRQEGWADWWIQRVTVAAMLALAVALVAIGVAFYSPHAHATSPSLITEGTHP